ncbi:unnamed protein product [Paramecium sonneborni]|uniref:Uncharacterized protein n=1 Tax=Paramecium sonneborni TaxID=65129 RepID=A0A8S1PK49_9CILI|nr:unnamed protein product [Paramecium sonneborni]
MQFINEGVEQFQIYTNIWANDVALFKDNYIMGFKGRYRKYALGGSTGLLMLTQIIQRNPIGALRVGSIAFPVLSYWICPEIYNSLL